MRKHIATLFGVFFLFASAQAAVTVKQNGKTVKYKDGAVVTVDGKADTTVEYNGVKFFVPKGVRLTLSQESSGIVVRGVNMSGVQVGNMTLAAKGLAVFSVTPKTEVISVRQGALRATAVDGSTLTAVRGNSFSATAQTASPSVSTPSAAQTTPEFVAADTLTNTASQQATQDVIETEEVLSPSAPR